MFVRSPRGKHEHVVELSDKEHAQERMEVEPQCSFVYPYPSVSHLAGGNSDHGPRKTRTKTQTTPDSVFTRERRKKTQTMV